jgi:hypothetical protein
MIHPEEFLMRWINQLQYELDTDNKDKEGGFRVTGPGGNYIIDPWTANPWHVIDGTLRDLAVICGGQPIKPKHSTVAELRLSDPESMTAAEFLCRWIQGIQNSQDDSYGEELPGELMARGYGDDDALFTGLDPASDYAESAIDGHWSELQVWSRDGAVRRTWKRSVQVDMPDWELLRQQKNRLIAAAGFALMGDWVQGLIHLIDHIQDSAVAQGVASESEVFGG